MRIIKIAAMTVINKVRMYFMADHICHRNKRTEALKSTMQLQKL